MRHLITRRGLLAGMAAAAAPEGRFVRVSRKNPRYLELDDGSPYIPIGPNICWERFLTDEQAVLAKTDERFRKTAQNGGNFTRVWLSHPFYDIEPGHPGEYDATRAARTGKLLAIARRHGIRVKLCLEHFRTLEESPPRFPGSVSMGRQNYGVSHGGPFRDMTEYFTTRRGRALYQAKLDFYARRYANEPAVFGWELWNEIDAVKGDGWQQWTAQMLAELKRRFPRHLALQSLGSYDHARKRAMYRSIAGLNANEIGQVHRYLDPGAALEVCRGPMDILASDAVSDLLVLCPGKPVLLSEAGAVEANHAGPSRLYETDKDGVLLHDLLFAAFFAGAAGPGQSWHWQDYIEKHDLWYHFGRFARAIDGVNPLTEFFTPIQVDHPRLRVYVLVGRRTTIGWCRDRRVAGPVRDAVLTFANRPNSSAGFYDPWLNRWTTGELKSGRLPLPRFTRSLIFRMPRQG